MVKAQLRILLQQFICDRADNLLAFRLAAPGRYVGPQVELLAGGLGDETGISVDVLGNTRGRNIAARSACLNQFNALSGIEHPDGCRSS